MRRLLLLSVALAAAGLASGASAGAQTRPAAVPTEDGSPWPSMRHDRRNTGRSTVRARFSPGDRPWAFRTGKGVFSTPVVGADETVYFGSADRWFYAVGREGKLRWRYRTGEVIDSAGVLGRHERGLRSSTITFGSGDEYVYRLRTTGRRLSRARRTVWRMKASGTPPASQLVNWWEGNVVMGPGGTLYAGNTGGAEYAINPDGTLKWRYPTGNAVWSAAAIADDGGVYFGSVDLFIYALDASGQLRWRRPTAGFVTSSPALGRDGTVYISSFDNSLHALDPATGADRFTFTTGDHIYGSPALIEGATGRTETIVIGSADGSVYALDPAGRLRWRYDTGDVVRSSPAIGRAPRGDGWIVYVGSANGTLYAIDAETGRRRWSFDTTPADPVLRDRDDLNGSPALGKRGVYIGGEHGRVVFVPYDYCLRHRDARCNTSPGEAFGSALERVAFVTPGGNTRLAGPPGRVSPATTLGARLVVRERGETVDAALLPEPTTEALVSTRPRFDFTAELSGDGHFLHVNPTGFLAPDTAYEVRVAGRHSAGDFADTLRFRTAPVLRRGAPLRVSRESVSAFDFRRMAVPLPPILPSVNQIGFDSYEMIVGTLRTTPPDARGEGTVLLWAVSSRRDARGIPVADARGAFAFPLAGRYRHDALILSARDLDMTFSFGEVPLDLFELRMQLDGRLRARPGASLYAEIVCPEVPVYGPALIALGLCNQREKLPASGTFITSRYTRRGSANRRPAGLRVRDLTLRRPTADADGAAVARLSVAAGARYRARDHALGIVLTDAASGEIVRLDYREALTTRADARGDVAEVTLTIPRGTTVPARVRAYVVADVYPLDSREL